MRLPAATRRSSGRLRAAIHPGKIWSSPLITNETLVHEGGHFTTTAHSHHFPPARLARTLPDQMEAATRRARAEAAASAELGPEARRAEDLCGRARRHARAGRHARRPLLRRTGGRERNDPDRQAGDIADSTSETAEIAVARSPGIARSRGVVTQRPRDRETSRPHNRVTARPPLSTTSSSAA